MGILTHNSLPKAPTGAPFPASLRDDPSHFFTTFAYKRSMLPSAPAIVFPFFFSGGPFDSSPNKKTPPHTVTIIVS
ncbi:hypothetical protein Taro_000818 [Colocasia esculenta]|uniref:Uncharacterized protein n=1 Tax=Colocasia esculenta TaxID=4460 RepID=A0A843TJ18_COLES|nr:hypothetical protein [Colocasia esculenta]